MILLRRCNTPQISTSTVSANSIAQDTDSASSRNICRVFVLVLLVDQAFSYVRWSLILAKHDKTTRFPDLVDNTRHPTPVHPFSRPLSSPLAWSHSKAASVSTEVPIDSQTPLRSSEAKACILHLIWAQGTLFLYTKRAEGHECTVETSKHSFSY